jgi:hypothetical protein
MAVNGKINHRFGNNNIQGKTMSAGKNAISPK